MTLEQAVLLGLVQGLTEFLPISSSGHLAIVQRLLPGFTQPGAAFDVALHVGTVLAVVVLEWRRLVEAVRGGFALRLGGQIAVAAVATALVALPLRGFAEAAFSRLLLVAAGLAASGIVLLGFRWAQGDGVTAERMRWRTAALVGLVQGVAVMPGLSRSGSTIVAGAVGGLDRRWAADFSFLLSVPAVVGAAVVEGYVYRKDLELISGFASLCVVGALIAAVVGGLTIVLVRRLVQQGMLHRFAWYLLPLACAVAVSSLLGWM